MKELLKKVTEGQNLTREEAAKAIVPKQPAVRCDP